jgi:acetyltransferase-like isoleucine patch superfamily enzyme
MVRLGLFGTMRSLGDFKHTRVLVFFLRDLTVSAKLLYFRKIWGMDLDPTVYFSLSVKFDRVHPRGVHIAERTYLAFEAAVLAHDGSRRLYRDTWIGPNCFIGARSIIMPGVRIGENCIIGAGSVVTQDVPPRCIATGNPARIVKENIVVGPYGEVPMPEILTADRLPRS